MGARGFRLSKKRVSQLREYLRSGHSAVQGQSYEPHYGEHAPEELFAIEQRVEGAVRYDRDNERISAVLDEMYAQSPEEAEGAEAVLRRCYGPQEGRHSLRSVLARTDVGECCTSCGLWCVEWEESVVAKGDGSIAVHANPIFAAKLYESPPDKTKHEAPRKLKCGWCRCFGDTVLLASDTEAALARARESWSDWMGGGAAWRWSPRSRAATAELATAYEEAKVARRELEERGGATYPGCSGMVVAEIHLLAERWYGQSFHLDEVAQDVIERALHAGDDEGRRFLDLVRRHADERLAGASGLLSSAWNALDARDHLAREAEEKKSRPVKRVASDAAALRKRPPPQSDEERVEALAALLIRMRGGRAAPNGEASRGSS